MEPLVTCVICAYDYGAYVEAAVRSALQAKECEQAFTAESSAGPSPNLSTAPAAVLHAMGVPQDLAESSAREGRTDLAAVQETLKRLAPYTYASEDPGSGAWVQRNVRVVHRAENGPWRLEYVLRLTPDAPGRPWQIVEPVLHAAPSAAPSAKDGHFSPIDANCSPSRPTKMTATAIARSTNW